MHNFFHYQKKGLTKNLSDTSNNSIFETDKQTWKHKMNILYANRFQNLYFLLFDLDLLISSYTEINQLPNNILFNLHLKQNTFFNINLSWFIKLRNNLQHKFFKLKKPSKSIFLKYHTTTDQQLQEIIVVQAISNILNEVHIKLAFNQSQEFPTNNNKIISNNLLKVWSNISWVFQLNVIELWNKKASARLVSIIKSHILDHNFNKVLFKILNNNQSNTHFFVRNTSTLDIVFCNFYLKQIDSYMTTFIKEYNFMLIYTKVKVEKTILNRYILNALNTLKTKDKKLTFLIKYNIYFSKKNVLNSAPRLTQLLKLYFYRIKNDLLLGVSHSKNVTLFIKNKMLFFCKSSLHIKKINSQIICLFSQNFQFLGFEFYKQSPSIKLNPLKCKISLKIFRQKLVLFGILNIKTKPFALVHLIFLYSNNVIAWFNFLAYGILLYYRKATNFNRLVIYFYYFLKWSLLFTLGRKHKKPLNKIIAKYKEDILIKPLATKLIIPFFNKLMLKTFKIKESIFFIFRGVDYVFKKML